MSFFTIVHHLLSRFRLVHLHAPARPLQVLQRGSRQSGSNLHRTRWTTSTPLHQYYMLFLRCTDTVTVVFHYLMCVSHHHRMHLLWLMRIRLEFL
jgi:hypothetical protein